MNRPLPSLLATRKSGSREPYKVMYAIAVSRRLPRGRAEGIPRKPHVHEDPQDFNIGVQRSMPISTAGEFCPYILHLAGG